MRTVFALVALLLCLAALLAGAGCARDTTPPDPPGNLHVYSQGNDSTPAFSWDDASDDGSGIARYWVRADSDDWEDAGEATTYTLAGPLDDGDHTFSVAAEDKTGNKGEAVHLEFVIDTTRPVASDIASAPAPAGASITWKTNEGCTSQVEYGTTAAYGQTSTRDTTLTLNHSVTLTGLTAGEHHYRVRSKDSSGNQVESTDGTFTACGYSAPTISFVLSSPVTGTTATITWITSQPATTRVAYGETSLCGESSSYSEALVISHTVTLTGLKSATTYHYQPQSVDACGRQAAPEDRTFDTPWVGQDGEALDEAVVTEYGTVTGADGHQIALHNSPQAENVTWAQLKQFLRSDGTDNRVYEDGAYVCADFAETLHNNAEEAGIRAAYVVLRFEPECVDYPTWHSTYAGCSFCHVVGGPGHACNVFMTTDRGLVYVDDTGTKDGDGEDRTVVLADGALYVGESIFSDTQWCPMGHVADFQVVW